MDSATAKTLADWYSVRELTAGVWTPAVLFALRDGALHFTDILTTVRTYSFTGDWPVHHVTLHDSILARTLKRLTEDGLLDRDEADGAFPPSVQYGLTAAGREILAAAPILAAWATRHADLIVRAQRNRRQGGAPQG